MTINLLFCYWLAGPIAWALLIYGTFVGRAKLSRLMRWRGDDKSADPVRVTILVPAKDEGAGVQRCIDSILALDWPVFNVIAIDDRSVDDTAAVLDRIAARDSRLTVKRIAPGALPEGWLGKCHALYVGTRDLQSEWLFFVDSDVTLAPEALRDALTLCQHRKYDALTVLTRLECNSFIERLMLPPLAAAWSIMYSVSLTNDDNRPNRAEANGQFFLIRRDAYEEVGGHEAVKDQIVEDVELARLLKSHEKKVRIFFAPHLASTRMHATLKQMFSGWSRIYSGTSRRRPWRILGAMGFILFNVLTLLPALAMSIENTAWLFPALVHWALMTTHAALVYRWSGNSPRFAPLHPLAAAIMLAIFAYALRKCQTGRIVWRDSEFVQRRR